MTRPLVRYHGGKWMLAPWILAHVPPHRVYVEPFGGGASVLLRKGRSHAEVYNDLDGEIVNLFRVARDQGDALAAALEDTPFARDEFDAAYETCADALERARRTVVRAAMGFGSNAINRRTGFRSNCHRSGSTPARDWMNYPAALRAITDRLRGVVIENRDALEVIEQHDAPETVFYVDPPYVAETRDVGRDYRHEMTDADHQRLLQSLREVRAVVVLSGYRSAMYESALPGWRRVDRHALADGAQPRVECLWLSPNHPGGDLFSDAPATPQPLPRRA